MIYYRMLWLAAALTGAANLLLAPYADGYACWLAAGVVVVICAITFKDAWGGR